MTEVQAVTAYNVPIPRAFPDRTSAVVWAESEGRHTFPGCKVVALTKSGPRTIWRDEVSMGRAA